MTSSDDPKKAAPGAPRFSGSTALVTGASRGIGAAIARQLAREGAFVFVNYRHRTSEAEQLLEEIRAAGGNGSLVAGDIADVGAVDTMFKTVRKERGALDILVNNAGITRDGFAAMMPLQDWSEVIATDLTGAFLSCRLAARMMMKSRRGRIVNISSTTATSGRPGQAISGDGGMIH